MRHACLVFPLLMLSAPVQAQNADGEIWTAAYASVPLGARAELSIDSIARFGEDGLYEAEFGGFLGYEVADGVKLAVGYLRVPGYDRGAATDMENRVRQQVSIQRGALSGRLRAEQRFHSTGDDTGWRLRPQVKFSQPLREGGGPTLVLSHESFIELNDTDWGQNAGWRRMRNFAGIDAPLAGPVSVEVGYLNQYDFGAPGERDSIAHVASVALSIDF